MHACPKSLKMTSTIPLLASFPHILAPPLRMHGDPQAPLLISQFVHPQLLYLLSSCLSPSHMKCKQRDIRRECHVSLFIYF